MWNAKHSTWHRAAFNKHLPNIKYTNIYGQMNEQLNKWHSSPWASGCICSQNLTLPRQDKCWCSSATSLASHTGLSDSSQMCLCLASWTLWLDIKSSSLANQAPREVGFPLTGPQRGTLVERNWAELKIPGHCHKPHSITCHLQKSSGFTLVTLVSQVNILWWWRRIWPLTQHFLTDSIAFVGWITCLLNHIINFLRTGLYISCHPRACSA